MEKNIQKLLDITELNKNFYDYFKSSKLNKIEVDSKKNIWNIYIDIDKMFPINVYMELINNSYKMDNMASFNYYFNVDDNSDVELYKDYYEYLLNRLKKDKKIRVIDIYLDDIKIDDNKIVLEADNKQEEKKLNDIIDDIELFYKSIGYVNKIDIKLRHNTNILEEINKDMIVVDIPKDVEDVKKEIVEDNGNLIFGHKIKGNISTIKMIENEINDVVVEAYIFGIELFESAKTGFKILTLKISDDTDSIYCKVFEKDDKKYKLLTKELKSGNYYRIRGYVKNDPYSRELVLNARDIEKIDKKDDFEKDSAENKRVELHAHTMMSQMDGVIDELKLVKHAIKLGHDAVAITDHNGVQAFPHVFNFITDYNKNLEDGVKPFKAIYGCELTLIDDSVEIVVRPNDSVMLDQTYVVFDFETTGFNAGGKDSIIEIGAVKIKNGEIIEKYDELINPGHPLAKRIIEVTNITDDMLKDKDNEENAIKRFIKWFGDCPMVAHNAKFDVSFLEMAYQKYNLGTFNNPVIDTLELSRTLDKNESRHSLSALVKRYEVPWDESAHHRGDYDAEGTALIFHKMLKRLDSMNIEKMSDLDKLVDRNEIHKFGSAYHVNLLVKNKTGLKNLFKIVSLASTTYLYKTPRILRSEIEKYRDGLLVGSGCYESEVFKLARTKSEGELANIINFYDYVEVQPPECYNHLIQTGDFDDEEELENSIKKIINTTIDSGKIVVATGDVHHLTRKDKIYREVIVNQKVPGGGRHPLARKGITEIPSLHFRTTQEMKEDFAFLEDDELIENIVVNNTKKIADMVDIVEVIIDTKGIPFSPRVKSDDGKEYLDCPVVVTDLVFSKAEEWYGNPLPHMIEERISTELYGDILLKSIKEEYPDANEDEIYKKLHEIIIKGKDSVISFIKNNLSNKDENKDQDIDKIVKKSLGGVIGGGFDPIYLIAQRLVKHSNDEGYLVGSRGSVGSSFVATMMGITEVNPLAAHYRCPKCKLSIFDDDEGNALGSVYSSGFDLPDKKCPNCDTLMIKDGQDMPFATFLGFNADKVPDIDLNFSDLNQASAHAYTKVLFGEDNVYRAGTIGTVADKTAFGFVKGYFEDNGIENVRNAEIERLAIGCTGVKRTTGQHPGGIVVIPDYMDVFDFTPFQFPADDVESAWRTTHFDYHAIDQCVLKLDILGHSDPTQLRQIQLQSNTDITKVPLDDKDTMRIFTDPSVLGVTSEQIMCNTGTLGIPEFGTSFTIQLVEDTKPTTFAELIKISGLSHGTDVWLGNAQDLIKNNVVPFKETIGCRDDIMVYLMYHGVEPLKAFKIMEFVRKGKASKDPETWEKHKKTMEDAKIPSWFIGSCAKIKYMFPKAHAAAYVISAFRIAWYKVHMPVYFYASWLTSKATDIDVEAMIDGYDKIKERILDIQAKGYDATNKEIGQAESLKVSLEATARGIKFLNIDLYKSDATVWKPVNDNEIYPPFSAIDGLGVTVAKSIVEQREKGEYLSIEDFQKKAHVSQTLVDKMKEMGILNDMPDSNQIALF